MISLRWFLRRLSPPRLPKPVKKYVGTVHGYSQKTEENGSVSRWDQFWVLTQEGSKRRAEHVGLSSTSPLAIEREAMVKAWLVGGPVPPLGTIAVGDPGPKPRKSRPQPKKENNVILLPRKSA